MACTEPPQPPPLANTLVAVTPLGDRDTVKVLEDWEGEHAQSV